MNFKNKRWPSYLIILAIYLFATIIGIISYKYLPLKQFWLKLLIADVIATVFTYLFSLLFKNSSVYDPYWSVQPIVIVVAFIIYKGFTLASLFFLIPILLWGIRLTLNWAYTFYGFGYQDWRYVSLKEKTKKFYPIVNLLGIHLFPTLVVYLCTLPAVFIIYYQINFNPYMIIFSLTAILAAVLQGIADVEMHKFRKNKTTTFIRNGLWKYSRHPNYLGEILMWWSVGFMCLILYPKYWFLLIGALINNLMFVFISIPMADKRQSRKEGFNEYKQQTRMLLPLKK